MRQVLSHPQASREEMQQRLMGWLGHAFQADSRPLIARLAAQWLFRGGRFQAFRAVPA